MDLALKTITVLLAGGVGSRLYPLTADRAKPAVPFGGKYRIIDFTLSNCLHSGLRRILVLTQYKSHSLQKHLRDGWSLFNPTLGEYITPVPPQMRVDDSWYSGTADAVFQNLYLVERSAADFVLILAGDHIYRMDYAAMIASHCAMDADVTVACMPVEVTEASSFGVLTVDSDGRVTDFMEKPADPKPDPNDTGHCLASMGIYVFGRQFLEAVLRADHQSDPSTHDFGRDVLPGIIDSRRVFTYRFGGNAGRVSVDRYWRDVGTLDAYHAANMDLLKPGPELNLYQSDWPIRTFDRQSPPARTVPGDSGTNATLTNSIVGSGTIVSGGTVEESILFHDVRVQDQATAQRSILFSGVRVGAGAKIRNCIIEKHVEIPAGESIGFDTDRDRARFGISEGGIVVVPKTYRF